MSQSHSAPCAERREFVARLIAAVPEALIVNPYHVEETADALHRALTMPAAEQRERMRNLRATVRERNVYRWAGFMLLDAARIRRSRYRRCAGSIGLCRTASARCTCAGGPRGTRGAADRRRADPCPDAARYGAPRGDGRTWRLLRHHDRDCGGSVAI